jgi:hypothetical protein
MVTWTPFRLPDPQWDAALALLPDANVFQSSAWARHKADFGWRPARALAGPPQAPRAAVQALVKALPAGARLLWARGGPLGEPALWDAGLRSTLLSEAGGPIVYGRVCSYREASPVHGAVLDAAGWKRPWRPLDRPMTYWLDLAPAPEALSQAQSSNWRHNLKRGQARARVADWNDPDPLEMESVYRSLESLKGLPPQHRAASLGSLARALGPALILKRAVVEGRTVALRACAMFGRSSVDLLAAAAAEARKTYASYALLWELILESRRRGAQSYDLGGADPDSAPGVADFKKGTGARLVETLGERDFASPAFLRAPAGRLISWKLGKTG